MLWGATTAAAQEACVVCSDPATVYRCTVEKSEKLSRFGIAGEKAVQTVCIKELARQGGHASCAVRRDTSMANCDGVVREISLASLLEAAPEQPQPASPPQEAAPAPLPAKPVDAKDAPPRTMQELAERTGQQSKQQLKSVGDSVGNAASKTWGCLSSFFTRC